MKLPVSIDEAAHRLRSGELTCTRLARACLKRIEALQSRLNAFLTITADAAMAQAEALERDLRAGADRGRLHGIPIVCKDCLDTAGVRTTVGSRYFADRVPAADARVVERLATAGAVMLGKTNMNEFAAGTSGKNAAYGDVRNPWALDRSPGGSSSGTAAAVAAGIALAGVGTDTGGSIRIPASCTGIVGIRPTPGRVSVRGSFPRSFSFDTVGPLARTVRDCALMFEAMAAHDPAEPHSLDAPVEDYASGLDCGIAGVRIGLIRDFSFRNLDAQVEHAVRAALDSLTGLGALVQEVAIPALVGAFRYEALVDLMLYEFHQILGGQWRACQNRDEVFGPMVRSNLERGMTISEPTYRTALASRASEAAALRAAFSEVDAFVTPVLPMLTPPLDSPPEIFERQRHFMIPFSFAGLPAISIPCGFSREGLPIGLQLVGDRLQEKRLFRIAHAYESATDWHKREPQRA
jgi:aspartyl-tRNA(Asn)/glutamyl-tRNA(Gln) amidotransferase subunit A